MPCPGTPPSGRTSSPSGGWWEPQGLGGNDDDTATESLACLALEAQSTPPAPGSVSIGESRHAGVKEARQVHHDLRRLAHRRDSQAKGTAGAEQTATATKTLGRRAADVAAAQRGDVVAFGPGERGQVHIRAAPGSDRAQHVKDVDDLAAHSRQHAPDSRHHFAMNGTIDRQRSPTRFWMAYSAPCHLCAARVRESGHRLPEDPRKGASPHRTGGCGHPSPW